MNTSGALITFLVLVISIFVNVNAQSGFYFGNPSQGTIDFVAEEGTSPPSNYFDSYVSRPVAICVDSVDNAILFSNSAPPIYSPWISAVSQLGGKASLAYSTPASTPDGTLVSSLEFDDSSEQLFFMFSELNPNKRLFGAERFDIIQRVGKDGQPPTPVYAIGNTTKVPTSFDIDPVNQLVYITTNGVSYGNRRNFGGIYSTSYNGGTVSQVKLIDQLESTNYTIGSIQVVGDNIYYIIKGPNSSAIYKFLNDGESSDPELVYNGTAFNPQQIVAYEENGQTNIWARENGNFFFCESEVCPSSATVSVHDGSSITDFDVNTLENFIYYVGPTFSSVLSYDISTSFSGCVINGIGETTKLWMDSSSKTLYYSGFNRIDSYDGVNWNNVSSLPFSIDYFTGDDSLQVLLVGSKQTGYIYSIQSDGSYEEIIATATSAITAQDGILYYTKPSQTELIDIMMCSITSCEPELIQSVSETVNSLYVNAEGDLYYGGANGIYLSEDYSPKVEFVENIMPFAIAFASANQTLYFLDAQDNHYVVYTCQFPNCLGTLSTVIKMNTVADAENINGWMVVDDSGQNLYWSSSSLQGEIYRIVVASKVNSLFYSSDKVVGLAISSDGNTLYASNGHQVLSLSTLVADPTPSTCSLGSVTVGDIEIYQDTLLWSDLGTGDVYKCAADCSTCDNSEKLTTGNPSCSVWQFITSGSGGVIFDQFACGGIVETFVEGSTPVTVKAAGSDPISDLAINGETNLFWTLPFRYSIIQGDLTEEQNLENVKTFYSGTGTFSNLVVENDTFYWIDPEAAKLLSATDESSANDFVLETAIGLTYFSGVSTSSTVTVTPAPSIATSPTASPSSSTTQVSSPSSTTPQVSSSLSTTPQVSSSPSTTPSSSSSASVSVSSSVTPTTSATPSISNSSSISQTRTTSLSAGVSPSATNTPSSTLSETSTISRTSTATPSQTSSPTLSSTITSTPTVAVITPTVSGSGNNNNTVSDTPSPIPTGTPTSLPVNVTHSSTPTPSLTIGASPSVTPSVTRSDIFYGSDSNTPGLPEPSTVKESPLISTTQWEWIGVVIFFIVVLCLIPGLYCCWRQGVEKEMALSLRLE